MKAAERSRFAALKSSADSAVRLNTTHSEIAQVTPGDPVKRLIRDVWWTCELQHIALWRDGLNGLAKCSEDAGQVPDGHRQLHLFKQSALVDWHRGDSESPRETFNGLLIPRLEVRVRLGVNQVSESLRTSARQADLLNRIWC
jgi:hypothetical protein